MTVLVTGATGSVGREIVRELLEWGERVRALTRHPESASFPPGVDVVGGDLTDPDSLRGVFDGVSAAHLITFGGELFAPLTTGPQIIDLAERAGVRRLTVLHGGGATPLESAVRASGLDWTVVMPVEFMSNALEWAPGIKEHDEVREPYADRLSAMVHEGDIGAVAAVALTEEGHAGREYLVTGPEVLSLTDKTKAIAQARGRAVALVELTPEEAQAQWRASGMPEDTVAFLVDVYGNTPPEGRTVTDVVPRVTGRPARTFAEWAAAHAEAFRAE
ncbi:NAD-dependent epimerase/dehydratase family protein [Streptomyces triticagri]|uniref:NAD-dependent epimerase/dehydratase family protein n=1 Tax=Streptomyces triticagri TaxID=2293568 RepID=A0A372M5V9_9ACTN|nr:NAD(P)H-binding protein [Streptomyces triticagri]RFU85925.1 NAD-dependent epimerase/dehydratase family protein [Streptomyces triticagri]